MKNIEVVRNRLGAWAAPYEWLKVPSPILDGIGSLNSLGAINERLVEHSI